MSEVPEGAAGSARAVKNGNEKNAFLMLAGWIPAFLKVTVAQAGMPVLLDTFYDS